MHTVLQGFSTLPDIMWYAHMLPEYPLSDSQEFKTSDEREESLTREIWFETQGHETQPFVTLLDPSYRHFYDSIRPNFFKRTLQFFGFGTPLWKAQDLKVLLTKHNQSRYNNQSELDQQQAVIYRLQQQRDSLSRCIVIGDLDGAFHSLSRILHDLARRGELDDNLKLIQKNTYLIFLGNIIGASPYCAELLTVILTLIERNPDHVWCLCGWNEMKQRWRASPLLSELSLKCGLSENDVRWFTDQIQDAFVLFPRSLVFAEPTEKKFIQFSPHDVTDKDTLSQIATCASSVSKNIKWCTLLERHHIKEQAPTSHCCSIIETKHAWNTLNRTEPFIHAHMPNIAADIVFDLLSGQTEVLRRVYRCFWESYCIVEMKDPLETSTIQFIGSLITNDDGFKCRSRLLLCTGELISNDCIK